MNNIERVLFILTAILIAALLPLTHGTTLRHKRETSSSQGEADANGNVENADLASGNATTGTTEESGNATLGMTGENTSNGKLEVEGNTNVKVTENQEVISEGGTRVSGKGKGKKKSSFSVRSNTNANRGKGRAET